MKRQWIKEGNKLYLNDSIESLKKLEAHVYNMGADQKGIYLTPLSEGFTFDYKIYGAEIPFINRVVKTWDNSTDNMGILLKGVKGTGKTVTAKLICNKLKLPTIIVGHTMGNFAGALANYLSMVEEDLVVFMDEFEKVFKGSDDDDRSNYGGGEELLTLMDGVQSTVHRRLFLLTTNENHINYNLFDRPGRIRYMKEFSDLSLDAINEILDDRLKHTEFKEECVEYLQTRSLITVDIVISLCEEVNIHKESPSVFADIFNVRKIKKVYNIYQITGSKGKQKEELMHEDVDGDYMSIKKPSRGHVGRTVNLYYDIIGRVTEVDPEENTLVLENGNAKLKYRIEEVDGKHSSFRYTL